MRRKPMDGPVRIGNAQGFWGDRSDAAAEMLARQPDLDYLTLDYLAEVSMSILARERERDPEAGFARDFVEVVRSLVPYWSSGGRCRLIANAGGLDPRGCAEACRDALEKSGCRSLRIGIITGDDILALVRNPAAASSQPEFRNLDTGRPISDISDRLVTANAYLGAAPIVEALRGGADIVITGRVADPSLTVAASVHHFGWSANDLDQLAGATVAGHLIECGTQVTGGISTDWLDVPDAAHIGFPIVEIDQEGNCIVTKPSGSGGRVTPLTVKEQLVYEIGDPENYLSPDVTVSFLSLNVEDLGGDRVRVSGATGKPRPDTYKVSATYRDAFRSAGTLAIIGRDAQAKARRCGQAVLARVRDAGFDVRDSIIECLGSGDGAAGIIRTCDEDSRQFGETVLRVALETDSREAAERFARELIPLITAGPQGTTGYAEGRPRVHSVFRYWPCLIARSALQPEVEFLVSAETASAVGQPSPFGRGQVAVGDSPWRGGGALTPTKDVPAPRPSPAAADLRPGGRGGCLYDIACARSGDKGTSANVGVIARSERSWPFLRAWLTADRVSTFFAPLGVESVDRYELPNLQALNFVLRGALRRSLRTDAQGKALGQILLAMPLPGDARAAASSRE
ncbi:MAG TPA: acyclic terpene utilization AtuA family protein [Lacipirellulaceae bacterium]